MAFGAWFSLSATDLYILHRIYYGIWCVVLTFSYILVHFLSDLLWHFVRCFLFQLRTCTFSIGFTMAFGALFSHSATYLYIFYRIYFGIWCVVRTCTYIFYRIYYGIRCVVFTFSYILVHFLSDLLWHLVRCSDLYIFYRIYFGIWCVVFTFSYILVQFLSDLLWHLVRCFHIQLHTCTFSIGFTLPFGALFGLVRTFSIGFTMAFGALFSHSATYLYIFYRIYFDIWCVVRTCTFSIGFTMAFGALFSHSATYLYSFYRICYGIWCVVFTFSYILVHFLSDLLWHLMRCFLFQLRTCTFSIGFTMAFGALFSKTWRVYKIFANKKLQQVVSCITALR